MRISSGYAAAALALVLLWGDDPGAAAVPQMRLVPYVSGLSAPLGFVQDPTDSHVQFVIEQGGRVRTLVDGVVQAADFLDLRGALVSGGEQGLLGLAFPPDAAASRRFYVNFTTNNPAGGTVVARFTRSASNPRVANAASRFDLRWSTDPVAGNVAYIPQPFANHNGGCLQFGPDGYLYVAMGDGGSGGDPQNNAQNPGSLLGKLLRVDVAAVRVPDSNPNGFVIPPDNPFRIAPGYRPEIWDVGLRNPWRFSFDDTVHGGNGALVIGDVGQGAFEEVDYEPRGRGARNYGWSIKEGLHDARADRAPLFLPLTNPIHEYDHSVGFSITGGYVYRGSMIPEMHGRYVFADYVVGRIWSFAISVAGTGEGIMSDLMEHTGTLQVPAFHVSSFGVDAGGELYIVNHTGGLVYKLVRGAPRAPTNLRIIR
jgi:glucose/arabinose dehydrogenase